MKASVQAINLLDQISSKTKLGDLRKLAKVIKKDHGLAMELWSNGAFLPRQLAILIMDSKQLDQNLIDQLDRDMHTHPLDERMQLIDWLFANQLTKSNPTISLIHTWENSSSSLLRRTYWYHQARLRWVGQVPPDNTEALLSTIEQKMAKEEPEVQWAMNFTAGWIGVYEKKYRDRCMAVGERTGLYKDEMVSKGCTPSYLPEFIAIESSKRKC